MRNIINIFCKAGIIALASYWFSDYVMCADLRTLVLAVLCMVVAGVVFALIFLVITLLIAVKDPMIGGISLLTGALLSGFIQLSAANTFVPGFHIHGILTYMILVVLFWIFSFSDSKKA